MDKLSKLQEVVSLDHNQKLIINRNWFYFEQWIKNKFPNEDLTSQPPFIVNKHYRMVCKWVVYPIICTGYPSFVFIQVHRLLHITKWDNKDVPYIGLGQYLVRSWWTRCATKYLDEQDMEDLFNFFIIGLEIK